MSKRQLVFDALNNKPVDRVPVGFWFHYTKESDFNAGLTNPDVVKVNIEGHKKFYNDLKPDLIKIMDDGFFDYPSEILVNAKKASDLYALRPFGKDHPWITGQVKMVKELVESFGRDIFTFYNIYSPAYSFRREFGKNGNKKLADFIEKDKNAVIHALAVIAQDLGDLAKRIVEEGGADGIYLCVQDEQDDRITPDLYKEIIRSSDLSVLSAAESVGGKNILHICGTKGSRNNLLLFKDYPAQAVNWAVSVEKLSLEKGKKLFHGRTVLGGFYNGDDGLLYKGSKEDIQNETKRILKKTGTTGIILGADCSIPRDMPLEHLEWVREAAR